MRQSTPPSRWPAAGPTRTVLKGRQGRTATVTGALGGSPCGPVGASVPLLFVNSPLHPLPRPGEVWGPGVCLCFQGIKTGQCVVFNGTHRTCEIRGWCPVESGTVPTKPLLVQAENFTLFIKNTVTFRKFNFSKSNALETQDPTYFKRCRYDPSSSPSCPVFRIGDLVAAAGGVFEDLALLGGAVGIQVRWDCDLDAWGSDCRPHYSFQLQERSYNFRTATHWWEASGVEARSLLKLYGIRFDILVTGRAGKFALIPTTITLGTGAAWLGVITFLCDLLLLYVDGEAPFYWKTKYEEAKAPKVTTSPEQTEQASTPPCPAAQRP
ncbi:P2X purinoceptor 6 isoform X1 [Vicugna pacos]|uniref:P2X purinoceptor 6 isoform X1 n=1 Tax=Vicugna pacos TaxID=30538 RepID=A0ABM5CL73_VICPA